MPQAQDKGITSPWEFAFGLDGKVFSGRINFNENTGALLNLHVDRSADLVEYNKLLINGIEVASPTPGGSVTVSGSELADFGLHVFADIVSIGLGR